MKKQTPNFLIPLESSSPWIRYALALIPAVFLFFNYEYFPVYLSQIPLTLCYFSIIFSCWINGLNSGLIAIAFTVLTIVFKIPKGFFGSVTNNSQGLTRISVFIFIALSTVTLLLKIRTALLEANASIRQRDDFLDLASHELKTPLTILKLNLSIAQQLATDGDAVAAANFLLKSSDKQVARLERLIGSMMDLTMFDSGQLSLVKKSCDLKKIVFDLTSQLNHPNLSVETSNHDFFGIWDPTRVEQIISNIVGNAIKYGEGKEIEVKVGQNDHHVWFSVKDQGLGIAKEDQERIFERFQRANISENVQGLGLGLYLTKQLVEIHGGEIDLESTPGAGSLFKVKLPA